MVALVLLPGMDGTASLLTEFAAAFGPGVHVVTVSYPGDRVLGYAELEHIARESLPSDEPFVLLGESFSGPIAISLAASAPPGLLGLVLCCTFARSPLRPRCVFRSVLRMIPARAIPQSLAGYFLFGRFSSPALRAALAAVQTQVLPNVLKARAQAALAVDVSEQLRRVAVPILDLRATEDRVVGRSSARHVATLAPHAQKVELVAPHMLLQVAPTAAAAAVGEFIGRVGHAPRT